MNAATPVSSTVPARAIEPDKAYSNTDIQGNKATPLQAIKKALLPGNSSGKSNSSSHNLLYLCNKRPGKNTVPPTEKLLIISTLLLLLLISTWQGQDTYSCLLLTMSYL